MQDGKSVTATTVPKSVWTLGFVSMLGQAIGWLIHEPVHVNHEQCTRHLVQPRFLLVVGTAPFQPGLRRGREILERHIWCHDPSLDFVSRA